jgi:predicted dehydrogenase
VDFVHINTPIPDHGPMSIAALEAGKHVMCTVPMATNKADCERIVQLVDDTGLAYMMAETVVYAREFLHVQRLLEDGTLGRLQFLRATHQQDMDGWPDYWPGLPPMWYATHCVGPCLALADAPAERVSCVGSGRIREELIPKYGSPFAVESAHVQLRGTDVCANVVRSLFDTARQYRESFDAYGSKASFEWGLTEGEPHVLHVAKRPEPEIPEPAAVPDFADRLPAEIQRFTTAGVYGSVERAADADDDGEVTPEEHLSFTQGGGHGGSHPHLAHHFVEALRNGSDPFPNARQSANWTCVGLCAHESAMNGGVPVDLPAFTLG